MEGGMKQHFGIGSIVVACLLLFLGDTPGERQTAGGQAGKPVIVSNPNDPVPPPGQRTKIVFKEELSIGMAEGDENYMFGSSVQATAD
jgi:hypothetical protein